MEEPTSQHTRNVNLVFAELLQQILENCTTTELLGLRLVNRQWKKVATKILLKKSSLKIEFVLDVEGFECDRGYFTFYSLKEDEKNWHFCHRHSDLDIEFLWYVTRGRDRTLPNFFRLMTPPPVYQPCASYSSYYALSPSPSSSLPVNNFGFHIEDSDTTCTTQPQMLSFFQTFGPQIKILTLNSFIHYFIGQPGMTDFLLQYTPNLEALHIRDKSYAKPSNLNSYVEEIKIMAMEDDIQFTLPHLKLIKIFHLKQEAIDGGPGDWSWATTEILLYLLEIAPQLERISFFLDDLKFVQIFPSSKQNLLHIRALRLTEKDLFFEGLEDLEYLVELMIKLSRDRPQGVGMTDLEMFVKTWPTTLNSWKRGTNALRQILQLNQNSLETMDLRGGAIITLHKIPGLPALPKVTEVTLDDLEVLNTFVGESSPDEILDFDSPDPEDQNENQNQDGGVHSTRNSISGLFPNVKALDLQITDWMNQDAGQSWFPFWNEELKSVKDLNVDHDIECTYTATPNAHLKSLRLCPEISSLEASWLYDKIPAKIPPLFNLAQLTNLQLNLQYWDDEDAETYVDFDAALTGLSKETVKAIYNNYEKSGQWESPIKKSDVDKEMDMDKKADDETDQLPRVNPSILNLCNLKKLQLDFNFDLDVEPNLLISGVSAKFAFDLMPNLEVLIRFQYDSSLGPASCPACDQTHDWENEKWMELHKPLLAFPRVTLKATKSCTFRTPVSIPDPDPE